jgi:hypothetical protein
MKMLINTFSTIVTNDLGIELIPMGIESIATISVNDTLSMLKGDEKISILLTENFEFSFLEQVKGINTKIHIFLIANQGLKPAELKNISKIGISAIINLHENISIMCEEILKGIIRNNIHSSEKRVHMRVQPKDVEEVKAAIYIKNLKRFVRGNVLDISAGGVAIKLMDSIEASILQQKTVYDPLLIALKGMEIKTISTLVARRDTVAGFKFENVESRDMKKIASYIHSRVTDNVANLLESVNLNPEKHKKPQS